MKLSELNTERTMDVLCELTPYIFNITGDKELMDELDKKFDGKGKTALYRFAADKIARVIPGILKTHRDDVTGILAVLNETTPETIKSQNILVTMGQIRDAIKDKELLDFFGSWQETEKTE